MKPLTSILNPIRMLLAGILAALMLMAATEYKLQRMSAAQSLQYARAKSAYDQCVVRLAKSGKYSLLELAIDAFCPVKPVAVGDQMSEARLDALQLAGEILGFCALPWAVSRLTGIKR